MSQEVLRPPRATASLLPHNPPATRSRAINEKLQLRKVGRDNHDALVALLGCLSRAMDREALETAEEFQYAIDCIFGIIWPDTLDDRTLTTPSQISA